MRYLSSVLAEFVADKFVLISGPRQVGKTTLALEWLEGKKGLYLNWDDIDDREQILSRSFLRPLTADALVFDELHKYPRWKAWLKGLYDKESKRVSVTVTGSARLDIFQRGGDSLLGRYEYLRLHPFTIGELARRSFVVPPENWLDPDTVKPEAGLWEQLEKLSGFPEPFLRGDARYHRRWASKRRTILVRQDLRELSQIRTLALVEHLALLLPQRVGSPLSLNALREELQVAHDTVNAWLDALERLYFCFRISPYHRNIGRSLRKEQKLYLWDWSQIEDPAARFENMVASHLLKAVNAWTDTGYGEYQLKYIRDKDKNEVDFVITEGKSVVALIECKLTDRAPASALLKFGELFKKVPLIQLLHESGYDRVHGRIRVVSADRFLSGLP